MELFTIFTTLDFGQVYCQVPLSIDRMLPLSLLVCTLDVRPYQL